jgi:hypothetical protein
MDVESVVQRAQRVPSADSAAKIIQQMEKNGRKMLRAGHGLAVDKSIQRHLSAMSGPTTLYGYVTN